MNLTVGEWLVTYGTQAFEIIGTLAFALSGLIEAARKKLDIVGMAIVTSLAAFGGGTLRDILLDRRPFFWVQNEIWIWIILVMCALAGCTRSRNLRGGWNSNCTRCWCDPDYRGRNGSHNTGIRWCSARCRG